MTPIIPFFSVLLISLMSFKEDTPPDIIIGILVFSAKANVSSNAGPIKIPSLLISVYIIAETSTGSNFLTKSKAEI